MVMNYFLWIASVTSAGYIMLKMGRHYSWLQGEVQPWCAMYLLLNLVQKDSFIPFVVIDSEHSLIFPDSLLLPCLLLYHELLESMISMSSLRLVAFEVHYLDEIISQLMKCVFYVEWSCELNEFSAHLKYGKSNTIVLSRFLPLFSKSVSSQPKEIYVQSRFLEAFKSHCNCQGSCSN